MTTVKYAEAVIKTALSNGLTMEDIEKSNPKDLAREHLKAQNSFYDNVEEQIKINPRYMKALAGI